jgi:hypothetical protein
MGQQAVEYIIERILGHASEAPATTRLECQLVVRSSVSSRRGDARPPLRIVTAAPPVAVGHAGSNGPSGRSAP